MTSSDASAPRTPTRRPRAAGVRLIILGVLLAALLAGSGTLIWLVAERRGEADSVQGERDRIMSQAQQFMLRVNTYGPDLLDGDGRMPHYRELVSSVITAKFKTSFDQNVTVAEQTVAQAGVARTAKVFAVGVSSLDADSARALVAGSFTNTYPQGRKGRVADDPSPFRVEVSLVKTDGTWLVDGFDPVTAEGR